NRARGAAADYDLRRSVACTRAESGCRASVAGTAELPGGTDSMGHQYARLAGRARREDLSDPHDRRRDQRTDSSLRTPRLHRREHERTPLLPGAAWATC